MPILLVVIAIILLAGTVVSIMIDGWPSSALTTTTFDEEPTLAATASLALYETEIVIINTTAVASATPPSTHTPFPTATMTPTPLPTATNTPTATPTPLPTETPTATATPLPPTPTATNTAAPTLPPPPLVNHIANLTIVPGQPQGFLDKFNLMAYYGSPLGSGLGVLGDQPRNQTLRLLQGKIAEYQPYSTKPFLPTYHMVVTVANINPPDYRHHLDLGIIEAWVAAAAEVGAVVILDIQPGRRSVMEEFNRLRYLLYEPHVHFAIDPEFVMSEEQVPLQNIGQLYASDINQVQASMNAIGYEIGLNKVLILHQFKDSMLPDKGAIEAYPFVELMIDGDGFGPAGPKIRNYNQYANEPGFEYGGFKLFPTDGDSPLMSADWVMGVLFPPPSLIIYQ